MSEMKIQTPLIITSFRTKVDGSLGLSASTPELTSEEKVAFIDLQNRNVTAVFTPEDEEEAEMVQVKGEIWEKSPSKRLHDRMFVYYQQARGTKEGFRGWYERQLDKIGERYLDKLN